MYESLTKYLTELADDEFGTWFIDKENDGTPEHPTADALCKLLQYC